VIKKTAFLLLLIFSCLSLFPQVNFSAEEKAWLKEHPVVTLAVDSQNPPMNYLDDSGQMQGITIEYMELISKKLGLTFIYDPAPWKDSLQKALDHQVDGIINASVKEDRKPYLNFTDSYFNTPDALLSLSGTSVFTGPSAFEGKTIAVIEGSIRKDVFLNYSPGSSILEVRDLEEGVSAVVDGRADGFLDEMPVIQNLTERFFISNVKINCLIFFPELGSAHIGLRNDSPELLSLMNHAIGQITREERQKIRNTYQPETSSLQVLRDPGFTDEERAWLKEHPVIRVGEDNAWAPMQFVKKGKPAGISQDYLDLISDITGLEFKIDQDNWSSILKKAENRELDMLSCARITPERQGYMFFTESYLDLPVVMLSRLNISYVDSERGLRKYRLGLLEGYAAEELFRREYPDLGYQTFSNLEQGIQALYSGEIDVLIENQQAINYYIAKERLIGLQIVGELPFSYELGMAVRDDWPLLLSILNKSLEQIDMEIRQDILHNWNYVTLRKEVDYKKFTLLLLAFSLVLILLLFSNLWMKKTVRLRTRQLEEARRLEALGNIAGGIAHDFKNILMGVSGYTELLQQDDVTEEDKKRYLKEILTAVDNGTDLSNQILMYSKGSGKDFKTINISNLCKEMLAFLKSSTKMDVVFDCVIEDKCEIYGDPTQIRQLLLNLGTNAFQAMKDSPLKKLTLRLEKYAQHGNFTVKSRKIHGPLIVLMVADSGCGIEKSNQSKIFDPYYTTKAREKGTGLGLATVDRIVKNHNGVIELYSHMGRGTSFTIYLPI